MIGALLITETRINCEAIRNALADDGRLCIAAAASSYDEATDAALESIPDITLLQVPLRDGLVACRALRRLRSKTRLVAFGVPDDDYQIVAWAGAGVSGCVAQQDSLEDLIEVVENVARGGFSCSPGVSATLFRRLAKLRLYRPELSEHSSLTQREREILELIAVGLSNKQIAQALVLQVSTVKNHVHGVFEKLGVHKRADAAAWATAYFNSGTHTADERPVLIWHKSAQLDSLLRIPQL